MGSVLMFFLIIFFIILGIIYRILRFLSNLFTFKRASKEEWVSPDKKEKKSRKEWTDPKTGQKKIEKLIPEDEGEYIEYTEVDE